MEVVAVSNDLFVSKCGRVFKEAKYTLRGNREVKYLCVVKNRKRTDVHRLVAEAFLPKPEGKYWVLHYDDNPHNNHVDNLRWGTPLENAEDARRNNRFQSDSFFHFKAKKLEKKEMVLRYIKQGIKYVDIATKLGISISRISQIVAELKKTNRL